MGSQAITESQESKPVIPLATACFAVRQGASFQREHASIVSPPTDWLRPLKTVEGSRVTTRAAARAFAAGACFLWLFLGTAGDGQCGEGATTAVERQILQGNGGTVDDPSARPTLVERPGAAPGIATQAPESAPTLERKQALEREQERDRAEALARTLTSSLRAELNTVQSSAEAAAIRQRQALDQERNRADTLARELATLRTELDTARITSKDSAQAIEVSIRQTQALEQERDKANDLARELTFLRAELDAARLAVSKAIQTAEAEIGQEQALEQERARADALARDLASLRAELDTARIAASPTAKAAAAEIEQKQAFERERARADALARDVASLRAELDTARIAASETAKANAAEVRQKQALEPKLKQQQGTIEALARELTSLRAELDAARAATQEAARTLEAAKIEQKRTSEKERGRAETLARELASAQKQVDERPTRLATAHTEVLQVTETNRTTAAEQKQALAGASARADALAQELASVRNQLEAANRQLAALPASRALSSRESAVDSLLERVAQFHLKVTEGKRGSLEQTFVQAAASGPERSSASELPPEVKSTDRDSAKLNPQVPTMSEGSSTAPRSIVDEQRLLARANALLRQADISGARPLLEHAVDRGSARAAFMLAETYDARVLQSWRARGISGDPAKARQLYERAKAGGIEDAKERLKTLK